MSGGNRRKTHRKMTPSQFRKANPHLSDATLAFWYSQYKRPGGAVAELASDENPRYVGVDYGSDDLTTECEVEFLPGGTMNVLDIRQTPPPPKR